MTPPTHQTVRLAKGKHRDPSQGVCVMELASMLAGEPFSDHPKSACPVIAAFLRSYNDGVDDERRQDLYRFASAVVGTCATADVQAARAELCRTFALEQQADLRPRLIRLFGRFRTQLTDRGEATSGSAAGRLAARRVVRGRPEAHKAAMAFLDRLIACGQQHPRLVSRAPQMTSAAGAAAAD